VTELEQRVESLLYRDLARIAGDTLEDGWDFVLFMPRLADVLDDDGIPDPEKIAVRAEQLAEWKPGLRKGARVPTPSFGQAAGRQSTMTAVPPGARCCAGLTEDAPGRPLAGPLGYTAPHVLPAVEGLNYLRRPGSPSRGPTRNSVARIAACVRLASPSFASMRVT
jgi:hypothetical protein